MLILQKCAWSLSIFLGWIKKLGKKKLFFLSHQVQDPLNGKKAILVDFNQVFLKLIQERTMISQLMKQSVGNVLLQE